MGADRLRDEQGYPVERKKKIKKNRTIKSALISQAINDNSEDTYLLTTNCLTFELVKENADKIETR